MPTIAVSRADVTSEEVTEALRDRLGPQYNVLPGMQLTRWPPFAKPRPGQPDTIVVGTGSNRVTRAQVTLTRRSAQTYIRVTPGGLISDLVLNELGIARQTRRVLSETPGLGSQSSGAD